MSVRTPLEEKMASVTPKDAAASRTPNTATTIALIWTCALDLLEKVAGSDQASSAAIEIRRVERGGAAARRRRSQMRRRRGLTQGKRHSCASSSPAAVELNPRFTDARDDDSQREEPVGQVLSSLAVENVPPAICVGSVAGGVPLARA